VADLVGSVGAAEDPPHWATGSALVAPSVGVSPRLHRGPLAGSTTIPFDTVLEDSFSGWHSGQVPVGLWDR
jgi:hypothetical protein